MQRIIIILITLLNYTHSLRAQTLFDKELLQLEQDVFVLKTDSERAPIILKKVDLYVKNNEISVDALHEARRIDYQLLPSNESKLHFLWNAAIIANLNNQRNYAGFYINSYHTLTGDSSVEYKLLSVLINNGEDSALLIQTVNELAKSDSNFACLTCLNEVAYYQKKNRNGYLLASVIMPGLGSILEGYPLKGMSSLLVNAASVFAIYELVRSNLYINAILWGVTLTSKFYVGNIKLTDKLFDKRESKQKNTLANKCKGKVSVLLKEHPILFR